MSCVYCPLKESFRSSTVRSAALSSKCGQCHVDSRVDEAEHRSLIVGIDHRDCDYFIVSVDVSPDSHRSPCRNDVGLFSKQIVCVSIPVRTLTTWHCPHSRVALRCCSNRSISHDRRAHSSKSMLLLAYAGSDGRTPNRFIDPAPRTMRASVNKGVCVAQQTSISCR